MEFRADGGERQAYEKEIKGVECPSEKSGEESSAMLFWLILGMIHMQKSSAVRLDVQ